MNPTHKTPLPLTLLALTLLLLTASACAMRDRPIGAEKTPMSSGTISGIVRAAGSNAPLSMRKVTALEVATGARFETSTAANGGYTMKIPTGKYRLEVELHAGETVVEGPSEVTISRSDLDAGRNFSISAMR